MTRHVRPPAAAPRLLSVLGPNPIRLRVAGSLIPLADQGAVSIRRSKPVHKPLGEPSALSCVALCDTPPTWRKGDRVSVELADTALEAIYGPRWVGSNYTPNPSFEVNTTGWTLVGGGATLARTTATHQVGVAAGRYTMTAAKAAGVELLKSGAMAFGTAEPGQQWSGRVGVADSGTNAGGLLRIELVAMNDALADLGVVARGDISVPDGGAFATFNVPSIAATPAGTTRLRWKVSTRDEFTSGNAFDFDAFHCHQSATPPTTYVDGSLAGYTDPTWGPVLHTWEGTANSSPSHAYVVGVPEMWTAARYRFVGRLADFRLATGRTGPGVAQLVATGTQAQLGNTDVGDVPWAAETVAARAARILTLAQAADPSLAYTLLSTATGPTVAWRDVDRQPVTDLLEELAVATGPLAGLVERRDGSLAFGTVADGTFPAAWLTDQVTPTQLDHQLAPRINRVGVDLGSPPLGTILRDNVVPNPGIEVDTSGWTTTGSAVLTRDTVTALYGTASLKMTPAAGVANPGAYTSWVEAPGQRWRVRMKVLAAVAGNYRLTLQHYTSGSVLISSVDTGDIALAASQVTELELNSAAAPATSGIARLYCQRVEAAGTVTAAKVAYLDQVSAYDLDVPGASTAPYFDGSTAATDQLTYAWAGTAGKSASRAVATANASPVVITTEDAASVAAYGPYSTTVQVPVDWTSPTAAYTYAAARGAAELLAGGWQPPPVDVDVLALLADPDDVVTTTPAGTTKRELAAALLMAELGSTRTIRRAVGDAAHVPPLHNVPTRISGLDESITAHAWTVTTEAERTA